MEFNKIPQNFIKNYLNDKLIKQIEDDYDIVNENKSEHILLNYILVLFGITLKEFQSKSRKRKFVIARQLFCFFCVQENEMLLIDIAFITNQTHPLVLYSKNIVKQDYEQGRRFKINGMNYRELFEKIRDRNICS
jgi:chromosomal replication initiation ATPase DnaA